MSYIIRIIFFAIFFVTFSYASVDNVYTNNAVIFLKKLIEQDKMTNDTRFKKLEAYLKALNKPMYMEFLKSIDESEEIFKSKEDHQLSMFFFAKWYLESLGKTDNFLVNIALLENEDLPWRWRWALLDILRPAQKHDLTALDLSVLTKTLRDISSNEDENEQLRCSLLGKNAGTLSTQLELVAKNEPDFKQRILMRDQTVLNEDKIKNNNSVYTSILVVFEECTTFEEYLNSICNNSKNKKVHLRAKRLLKEWSKDKDIQ